MTWEFVTVLPNLQVVDPIDSPYMALVGDSDERLASIMRTEPVFEEFLGNFSDPFGVPARPSVLIRRLDAPESFKTIDAAAGFRDAVAVNTIGTTWSLLLAGKNATRIAYTDQFAFYPWAVSRDPKYLIGTSPAVWALHDPKRFRGQIHPGLSPMEHRGGNLDRNVMVEMLNAWSRRFGPDPVSWKDTALFRSLNMAFHAGGMPVETDMTPYDAGRALSLWISAMEIIVHPGGTSRGGRRTLQDTFSAVKWMSERKSQALHDNAASILKTCYDLRNAFTHGNPVEVEQLKVRAVESQYFHHFMPVLYALLLRHVLDPTPPGTDLTPDTVGAWLQFQMGPRRIEDAIEAFGKSDQDDDAG